MWEDHRGGQPLACLDPCSRWGRGGLVRGDYVFHDVNGASAASMARAIVIDPFELGPEGIDRVGSVGELLEAV